MIAILALMTIAQAPAAGIPDVAPYDLLILGETRPILLRVRVSIGDHSAEDAWTESVRGLASRLDRDGDGKLTPAEAEAGLLLIDPAAKGRGEVDVSKDGIVSAEELADALRESAGPFALRDDGATGRRTDALFDVLDRDKDGRINRSELSAVAGTLRKLDRDDDETVGVQEVDPVDTPAETMAASAGRAGRVTTSPTVIEIRGGESMVRPARSLIKKYDKGSARRPGRPDSRVDAGEIGLAAGPFASADANGDGSLDAYEVRRYLAESPRDVVLDVRLSPEPTGHISAEARTGDGSPADAARIRRVSEGVIEVSIGAIRLDLQVDDGLTAADAARRDLMKQFEAADTNQDGYVESSELTRDDGQAVALAGPFKSLDRDGDGKLYPREIDASVADRAAAARARLTLTASDEGRSLFGLLDADRDRRLGAREILDTPTRVSACDRDGDGLVGPDEIPHDIRLTLLRGDLGGPASGRSRSSTSGPDWFRRMDRNRDGDVSRREFFGSREQFDRLDLDHDGLIGPPEAEAARPAAP